MCNEEQKISAGINDAPAAAENETPSCSAVSAGSEQLAQLLAESKKQSASLRFCSRILGIALAFFIGLTVFLGFKISRISPKVDSFVSSATAIMDAVDPETLSATLDSARTALDSINTLDFAAINSVLSGTDAILSNVDMATYNELAKTFQEKLDALDVEQVNSAVASLNSVLIPLTGLSSLFGGNK